MTTSAVAMPLVFGSLEGPARSEPIIRTIPQPPEQLLSPEDAALLALGRELRAAGYRFVTPTPSTHARVMARGEQAADLAGVFGWNRPFKRTVLSPRLFALLDDADMLSKDEGRLYRAKIRYSTLDEHIFLHSAFPTAERDSVFFGPDTYRFARAIHAACRDLAKSPRRIVDIGAGSGAGGIIAQGLFPEAELLLTDINMKALKFCAINAMLNDAHAVPVFSDVLSDLRLAPDLILANPPYLVDGAERAYRHGGGEWGFDLSKRIVAESLERLTKGGTLVLYTGAPIVNGADVFFEAVKPLLAGHIFTYEEIDADVFGEELDTAPHSKADRIAVVVLTVHKDTLAKTLDHRHAP